MKYHMNLRKNMAGVLVAAGMIAGFGFGMSHIANAENDDNGQQFRNAHALGSTLEVHINDNGRVLVRGAKVTSVDGATIHAAMSWNAASLTWTIVTNNGTKFVARSGETRALPGIAVGDYVSFSGNLAGGASGSFTVNASAVKDWSMNVPANVKTTVEGKVQSVSGTAAPMSFVLSADGKNYTVKVGVNTSILNNLWQTTPLSNIRVDDSVRVYGRVNSDMTIDATVVRDTSVRI